MAASLAGLTPICTLALLGVCIFIEGVSKAQRFGFTSLDPVASGGCHSVALSRRVNGVSPSSTLSLRGLISTPLSTCFSDLGPYYTLLDGIRIGRLVKL
jgi:hypothetical protein